MFCEQMYTQNVSIPPDYFGDWRSSVPLQNDNGHDWPEEDCQNSQERTGMFLKKHFV